MAVTAPASPDPLAGATFYDPPDTPAAQAEQAAANAGQGSEAAALAKIATEPTAIWLSPQTYQPVSTVSDTLAAASALHQVPIFVLYAIPERDCHGYSAGGFATGSAYTDWVASLAAAQEGREAVWIVEPDALGEMARCLDASQQQAREALLAEDVTLLTADAAALVYLDAGTSHWPAGGVMAGYLRAAGVAHARGFALNVSNFFNTAEQDAYGDTLSRELGGKAFVVDTSRNGNGPLSGTAWCNPQGRALGAPPTAATGDPAADADLWIKYPGRSDGTCNGGPEAGTFWTSYAVGLAEGNSP